MPANWSKPAWTFQNCRSCRKPAKHSHRAGPAETSRGPTVSPPTLDDMPAKSPAMGLAEAWISIGLGILLLFIFPNTLQATLFSGGFEQNNPVTDPNGNTIPYLQSIFFLDGSWGDGFCGRADRRRNRPGGQRENSAR